MKEIGYDKETQKWFDKQPYRGIFEQTTVCQCEKCGLYYKPILGHKCKRSKNDEL